MENPSERFPRLGTGRWHLVTHTEGAVVQINYFLGYEVMVAYFALIMEKLINVIQVIKT